jgi:RHS repeat-associated protein
MVVTAPSMLAGPPTPGRSAARIASDDQGATEVAPENAVFEQLARHRSEPTGATCIGPARPHRRASHPGRRRFSGQTRNGRYCRARYYHPGLQRFIAEDPVGFAGGDWNLYSYVRNSPLAFVDPRGLDIAVIENGPTGLLDNPVGHTAIAITGYGVFSYGNTVYPGSSLADYLVREAPKRDTRVHILRTTPEQDAAAVAILFGFGARPLGKVYADNCSSRINAALDAARISTGFLSRVLCGSHLIPGSAGCRATLAGASPLGIPRGSRQLPSTLDQFEPAIVGPW